MTKRDGTVSVLMARAAVDALAQRGIAVEPVLSSAHLSRGALESLDNRLPHESVSQLWEEAARAAGDPAFGVHVAEALPLGSFDLFDYLISVSATVGEGLTNLSRYIRLVHDRSNLHLVIEPGYARLLLDLESPSRQRDEFALTLLLCHARKASGNQWSPEHLTLQHESCGEERELSRVFGCPITYGAREAEIKLALSILQLPLLHADSRLLAVLIRYADSLLSAVPSGHDLVASVSSAIARQLAKGPPSLSATAAALHYPERTLQRQLLADHGTNHSILVDRVRRDLALKCIGDPRLSIGEIAYLLRFGESPSFHRAFKRWTGETPSDYRRRLFDFSPEPGDHRALNPLPCAGRAAEWCSTANIYRPAP